MNSKSLICLILVFTLNWDLGAPLAVPGQVGTKEPQKPKNRSRQKAEATVGKETTGTPTSAAAKALSSREIIDRVSRSLVLIVTQDEKGEPISQGSGFFFTENLVATNLHVFQFASQGYVKLVNGQIVSKIDEIVGADPRHDLCIFRVSGLPAQPLPFAPLDGLAVGDEVYVGGNPRWLEGTFSHGIISGIRGAHELIQIDAAISAGSSGGPVVNNRAEVIGVASSTVAGGQNLNFAIPGTYVEAIPQKWKAAVVVVGSLSVSDREYRKLKGPVHRVTTKIAEWHYQSRTGRYIQGPSEEHGVITYNDLGNEVEDVFYDHRMGKVYRMVFEYDQKGFLTRRTSKEDGVTKPLFDVVETESQLVTKLRAFSCTNETGITKKGIGTWDRSGNQVQESRDFEAGTRAVGPVAIRTFFSYNKDGYKIEETEYTNGRLSRSARYTYELDAVGNWIRQDEKVSGAEHPEWFVPSKTTYREIGYYH